MNIKPYNSKIGNQLGGLIRNFVVYAPKMQTIIPCVKEQIMNGMLELANIELSAQYVHPEITARRESQFMEWEITTLGSADLVENLLDQAIKLN
jgi:hypothetical protein